MVDICKYSSGSERCVGSDILVVDIVRLSLPALGLCSDSAGNRSDNLDLLVACTGWPSAGERNTMRLAYRSARLAPSAVLFPKLPR
jgi:hypothetical protein